MLPPTTTPPTTSMPPTTRTTSTPSTTTSIPPTSRVNLPTPMPTRTAATAPPCSQVLRPWQLTERSLSTTKVTRCTKVSALPTCTSTTKRHCPLHSNHATLLSAPALLLLCVNLSACPRATS